MTATAETLKQAPPATLPLAILRALTPKVGIAMRAADDDAASAMPTLTGHFSVFNNWYEVESWMEGHFMERVASGAFKKTISESQDQMKVLFDHGMDPQIGNKVLGPIDDLREDAIGPAYVVPLLDTSYNRDLAPGLEAGVYGSSFRFIVIKDEWDMEPGASSHNPNGLPERTITEARVFEFGPVTFPANPDADAGVRSITDRFYEHLRSKAPEQFEASLRSVQLARTPAGSTTGAAPSPTEPAQATRAGMSAQDIAKARRARRAQLDAIEAAQTI